MNEKEKQTKEFTRKEFEEFAHEFKNYLDESTNSPKHRDLINRLESRVYFFAGLGLGAIAGIFGNLFSTFLTEAIRIAFPDQLSWSIVVTFCFVLVTVILGVFAWWVLRELIRERKEMEMAVFRSVGEALAKTKFAGGRKGAESIKKEKE